MILVIYDSMRAYTTELVRYLSMKNHDIRTAAFFEKPQLIEYCSHQAPDLLLVEEALLDDQIRALEAGRIAVLTESDATQVPEEGELLRIGRYQSADEILADLLLLVRPEAEGIRRADGAQETAFTVFYAPVPCPEQSDLVMQFACEQRRSGSVLYLNLGENAGFEERFARNYKRDLSDLLFLSIHREGGFRVLLRSMVCEDAGIEYVPPMEQTVNAFLVPEQQWRTFLQHLKHESGYEQIIFDLQFLFPAAYEILRLSSVIYLPMQGEGSSPGVRHFLRIYEKRFGNEALKKLREVRLKERAGG